MRKIGTMCLSAAVIDAYHECFTQVTKTMVVADDTSYAVRGYVDSTGHTYMSLREINCDYGYLPVNCGLGPMLRKRRIAIMNRTYKFHFTLMISLIPICSTRTMLYLRIEVSSPSKPPNR